MLFDEMVLDSVLSELREGKQKLQKEFDSYRESHGITNDRAKTLEDERNASRNKCIFMESLLAKAHEGWDKARKERDELRVMLDSFPLGSHAVISLGDALGFRGNSWNWCIDRVISLREKADRMDDIIAITRQVKP